MAYSLALSQTAPSVLVFTGGLYLEVVYTCTAGLQKTDFLPVQTDF